MYPKEPVKWGYMCVLNLLIGLLLRQLTPLFAMYGHLVNVTSCGMGGIRSYSWWTKISLLWCEVLNGRQSSSSPQLDMCEEYKSRNPFKLKLVLISLMSGKPPIQLGSWESHKSGKHEGVNLNSHNFICRRYVWLTASHEHDLYEKVQVSKNGLNKWVSNSRNPVPVFYVECHFYSSIIWHIENLHNWYKYILLRLSTTDKLLNRVWVKQNQLLGNVWQNTGYQNRNLGILSALQLYMFQQVNL